MLRTLRFPQRYFAYSTWGLLLWLSAARDHHLALSLSTVSLSPGLWFIQPRLALDSLAHYSQPAPVLASPSWYDLGQGPGDRSNPGPEIIERAFCRC